MAYGTLMILTAKPTDNDWNDKVIKFLSHYVAFNQWSDSMYVLSENTYPLNDLPGWSNIPSKNAIITFLNLMRTMGQTRLIYIDDLSQGTDFRYEEATLILYSELLPLLTDGDKMIIRGTHSEKAGNVLRNSKRKVFASMDENEDVFDQYYVSGATSFDEIDIKHFNIKGTIPQQNPKP